MLIDLHLDKIEAHENILAWTKVLPQDQDEEDSPYLLTLSLSNRRIRLLQTLTRLDICGDPYLVFLWSLMSIIGCPVTFCFSCVVGSIFLPYFDHFIVQKLAPSIC